MIQVKTFRREIRTDRWGKFFDMEEGLTTYEERVNKFLSEHKIINIQTTKRFGKFVYTVTYEV